MAFTRATPVPQAVARKTQTYGGVWWRADLPGNVVRRSLESPVRTAGCGWGQQGPCYTVVVFGLLALAFLLVPIVEIYVIIQVGEVLGGLATIGIIIAMAMIGAALARTQGFAAVRRVQEALATGQQIGRSLVEGALVLVSGVLMITPGFITDGIGILLLLPPVRALVAHAIIRRAGQRVQAHVVMGAPGPWDGAPAADEDPPPPGVIDV